MKKETLNLLESIQSSLNKDNKKYVVKYVKIDNNDSSFYEEKTFNNEDEAKKFSKSLKDNKKYFYRDIKIKERDV